MDTLGGQNSGFQGRPRGVDRSVQLGRQGSADYRGLPSQHLLANHRYCCARTSQELETLSWESRENLEKFWKILEKFWRNSGGSVNRYVRACSQRQNSTLLEPLLTTRTPPPP